MQEPMKWTTSNRFEGNLRKGSVERRTRSRRDRQGFRIQASRQREWAQKPRFSFLNEARKRKDPRKEMRAYRLILPLEKAPTSMGRFATQTSPRRLLPRRGSHKSHTQSSIFVPTELRYIGTISSFPGSYSKKNPPIRDSRDSGDVARHLEQSDGPWAFRLGMVSARARPCAGLRAL